ncbi:hypothetical protein Apa02nite_008010 [Actinoplanes palleronii]|uniref:Uncharacterized protein n=2 Tax=Actinoplanes palleronii TaxID=113570 RepID=A0ABQ4B200_9ACTN|nr:hypothetical protein Apa02nite_008010 [Actinoplanes palleronii]
MIVVAGVSDEKDLPALQSLYAWLRREHEVEAVFSPRYQGAAEIVNIVLSNSIALAGFLVSLRAWLGARPRRPPITVTRRGMTVTVDGSPESLEQLERWLREELDDDGGE